MRNESDLREFLTRELRPVAAPDGLWERIEPALDRSSPMRLRAWRFQPLLIPAFAVFAILLSIPLRWLPHADRSLDLQSYLAPVQNASDSAIVPAISRTPPRFQSVPNADGLVSLAGYDVTAQRIAKFDGGPVKQLIFTASDDAVALFIASPQVRLDAGVNRWVEGSLDGVACKRLNCPRVRTLQFPCSKETCVLVCKTCSEQALVALMTQVAARTPEFR